MQVVIETDYGLVPTCHITCDGDESAETRVVKHDVTEANFIKLGGPAKYQEHIFIPVSAWTEAEITTWEYVLSRVERFGAVALIMNEMQMHETNFEGRR
jgi:hypothetical protein